MAAIQQETAIVWCERAVAAYQLFLDTKRLQWLLDGEEYYHEALEHAAMVSEALSSLVRHTCEPYRLQVHDDLNM